MHIGIIKEGKTPPDSRVPLTPKQCHALLNQYSDLKITVQPSPSRCYSDEEYSNAGITLSEDLSACEVLLGVKEVPIDMLLPKKTYFFFSHTIKKQPYNKKLLKSVLAKQIRLVDYECIRDEKDRRIIGFGKYAGIVGAHNGLLAYGKRDGSFELKRAIDSKDFEEIKSTYKKTAFPPFKTAITGGGRVTSGVREVLEAAGIKEVSREAFLNETFDHPVYHNVKNSDIYSNREDGKYSRDYYANPEKFNCDFEPYWRVSDLFINGIYWNPVGPAFFSIDDLKNPAFKISVIADITCDIAPESSVPSTLFATTIAEPFFDYDKETGTKAEAFSSKAHLTMMTIDNLPNELPRDASSYFGSVLGEKIIPELLKSDSNLIHNASITVDGQLNEPYSYLEDYAS